MLILELDEFMIERFDKAVQFAQDWLFLSQKRIEQVVLLVYVAVFFSCMILILLAKLDTTGVTLCVVGGIFLFAGMWLDHMLPTAVRAVRRVSNRSFRLGWLFMWLITTVSDVFFTSPKFDWHLQIYYIVGCPIRMGLRLVMAYIIALDVDGERGKAAKLSLAKLKELFGTLHWIPQPQDN